MRAPVSAANAQPTHTNTPKTPKKHQTNSKLLTEGNPTLGYDVGSIASIALAAVYGPQAWATGEALSVAMGSLGGERGGCALCVLCTAHSTQHTAHSTQHTCVLCCVLVYRAAEARDGRAGDA